MFSYVVGNPIAFIDPAGTITLPNDPSGLPPDWTQDPTHQDPTGSRWRNPQGGCLDFNPGRPGAGGNQEGNHWHDCTGGRKDRKRHDRHWKPGEECPQPGDQTAPYSLPPPLMAPGGGGGGPKTVCDPLGFGIGGGAYCPAIIN